MNNYVVDPMITCTGQKTRNVVHIDLFYLVDRVMTNC